MLYQSTFTKLPDAWLWVYEIVLPEYWVLTRPIFVPVRDCNTAFAHDPDRFDKVMMDVPRPADVLVSSHVSQFDTKKYTPLGSANASAPNPDGSVPVLARVCASV
jgi:hypothetical protein